MQPPRHYLPFLVTAIAAVSGNLFAQSTLRITYPEDRRVVHPGETVVVNVLASGKPFLGVAIIGADPIGFAPQILKNPPYQGSVTIPTRITPGLYTLSAAGRTELDSKLISSDPVYIDVERPDSPESISTGSSRLELDIGSSLPIHVYGKYHDGSIADLTKSTQTSYVSQSLSIATVTREGWVTAVAPGSTEIVINQQIAVLVTVDPPIRIVPAQTTLTASQTREFTAHTSGFISRGVTWSLDPSVGSINEHGIYTAPVELTSRQEVTLTATSVAEPTKKASVPITLSPAASVSIVPGYAVLYGAERQQFKAIASNAGTAGLVWSIRPASEAGTIDSNGLFTAPAAIGKLQAVTITATSVSKPALSGSTTIYISPPPFAVFIPADALSLTQGQTASTSVLVLATDKYPRPISLSITGVPRGVSASFAKATVPGNSQTTLTLKADAEAAEGRYSVTVIAQDPVHPEFGLARSFTLTVGSRK